MTTMTRFEELAVVRHNLDNAIRAYIGARGEPEDVACDDVAAIIAVANVMERDHAAFFSVSGTEVPPPDSPMAIPDPDATYREDLIVRAVLHDDPPRPRARECGLCDCMILVDDKGAFVPPEDTRLFQEHKALTDEEQKALNINARRTDDD